MKIRRLKLQNFRQYVGRQEFDFATDVDRPVTIIFGGNGAGKTTLLNAFIWGLYGEFGDDVEEQHRLASDSVWLDAEIGDYVDVSVEIEIDHGGEQISLCRTARFQKKSSIQTEPRYQVKMRIRAAEGEDHEIEYPQPRIEAMLPRRLSRFFFFNGERIEKLVQKDAYQEVREDVKSLLGLEQIERAIGHLPKVESKLGAELRKHAVGDVEVTQARIEVLRALEEEANVELSTLVDARHSLAGERETVLAALRQHESAATLQREIERVSGDLRDVRALAADAFSERIRIVAEEGFVAFTKRLTEQTLAIVEDEPLNSMVWPVDLRRSLVAQLIGEGTCVCGTPLVENPHGHQALTDWSEQPVGRTIRVFSRQRFESDARDLTIAREKLSQRLESVSHRLDVATRNVHRREDELSSLRSQLSGSSEEEVQSLQRTDAELASRIQGADRRIGAINHSLQHTLKELATRSGELRRANVKDTLAAKARERLQTVREAQSALKEILEIRSANVRDELDKKIKEVFARISIKPYVPVLAADYSLGLFQNSGVNPLAVAKSTGENQILSLSFVAAVSELARDIASARERDDETDGALGVFPVVMDAAFGSLDETYQREVARILPTMAPQLVVFVSKSQGLGHVLSELTPFVGRLGVVVTHTTRTGKMDEQIALDGTDHPYVVEDEIDYAELRLVR